MSFSSVFSSLNVRNGQLGCCVRALVAGRGSGASSGKNGLRVGGGAEIGVCSTKLSFFQAYAYFKHYCLSC